MKILLLSPLPLGDSNDGVKLRGRGLLQSLERVGSVKLLAFGQQGGAPADCPLPAFPGAWERLLSPTPSLVRCFRSTQFLQLVSREAADCDLCVCLGLQMFQYARAVPPGVPVILDNYNVESDILWGLARQRRGLKSLYWKLQACKLQRYEKWALSQADRVIAISQSDLQRFQQLAPTVRTCLVPPGLNLRRLQQIEANPEADTLTFVGALDWHVNIDCAVWFATQVLPRIRDRRKDARFQVVGRSPHPQVLELGKLPGVSVHPDVPSIEPFLEKSTAVVVPLRFGSGVQGKVIEGLAAGRPVLTSPIGFEGLDVVPGRDLLICEDVQGFVEQSLRVLEDQSLAAQLASNGRTASRHYELERMCSDIARLCLDLNLGGVPARPSGPDNS